MPHGSEPVGGRAGEERETPSPSLATHLPWETSLRQGDRLHPGFREGLPSSRATDSGYFPGAPGSASFARPPPPLGWGLFPCHSPRKAPSEDPLGYVFSGHPTHLTSPLLTHCHPHPGEPASVQSSLCLAPPSLPHRLQRGGLARCSARPDPAGLDELSQVQKSSRSEAAAVFRQRGRGAEAPSELLGLGGAALQWTSHHPPESWLTACPQMGAWGGSRPGQWGVQGQVVWV